MPAPEYLAASVANGDNGVALLLADTEVHASLLEPDVGEQCGGVLPQQFRRGGASRVAENASVETPLPITVASNE